MYERMKKLAEKYHDGQFREARPGETPVPYIEHPKAVVKNLLTWGEPESSPAIGIAWGHDLLEDTAAALPEILAASDATVADGIRLLTCAEGADKQSYLRNIARSGSREALLVKISDRIQNTRDFISLEGPLRAFRYLRQANCIFEVVQKLPQDAVTANAIAAWKELDESLRGDARHDAVRGCLLGGAVGDALGSPVEFLDLQSIRKRYGEEGVCSFVEFGDGTGAITDDTQMTLFTAEGILRAETRSVEKGICDPVAVMRHAYLRWLKTQNGRVPPLAVPDVLTSGRLIKEKRLFARRAPGMTCISALENSFSSEKARNDSKGCGTVMRMAPAGLFLDGPVSAYEYGCRFSALTHGHETGITAGGAFAMLIAELLSGKTPDAALDPVLAFLEEKPEAAETAAALRKARTAEDISELGQGWVAEEALAMGMFCALRHSWDFRAGVVAAVNITGDSDSVGAVAGNLLGVINGESAIPAEWLAHLREREIVSGIADDLWKRCETGDEGHVTDEWWEKYPGF